MLSVVSGNAVSPSPLLKVTINFPVVDTLQLWRANCDFILQGTSTYRLAVSVTLHWTALQNMEFGGWVYAGATLAHLTFVCGNIGSWLEDDRK